MANRYNQFKNLVNSVEQLAGLAQKAYEGNRSPMIKQAAAQVSSEESREQLLGNPSSEQLYGALANASQQAQLAFENVVERDLEGILKDAPNEIIDSAVKITSPVLSGDENHDSIVKMHKNYNHSKKALHDYVKKETHEVAKQEMVSKVSKIYDKRYADKEESKKFMKKLADINGVILISEYQNIVDATEEKFNQKLNGNEAKYLYENVKGLENKEDFIGFILSGDKKQLVQNAIANGDEESAERITNDIRMDVELARQESGDSGNILLRQSGSGANGSVLQRPPGIQRSTQRVALRDVA